MKAGDKLVGQDHEPQTGDKTLLGKRAIRAATRAMLLETARELIVREGEEALTLSAVADEAGLAHATVYGYFTGKRDLLAAIGPVQSSLQSHAASEPVDEHAALDATGHQPSLAALLQEPVTPEEQAGSSDLDRNEHRTPVTADGDLAEATEETLASGETLAPDEQSDHQISGVVPKITPKLDISSEPGTGAPTAASGYLDDEALDSDFCAESRWCRSELTTAPQHPEQLSAVGVSLAEMCTRNPKTANHFSRRKASAVSMPPISMQLPDGSSCRKALYSRVPMPSFRASKYA